MWFKCVVTADMIISSMIKHSRGLLYMFLVNIQGFVIAF